MIVSVCGWCFKLDGFDSKWILCNKNISKYYMYVFSAYAYGFTLVICSGYFSSQFGSVNNAMHLLSLFSKIGS